MKTKIVLVTVIAFCLLIGGVGCKDESYSLPSEPRQAILGKWELIEVGNWPDIHKYTPWGYKEYLEDSIIGIYEYETEEYYISNMKYWIDSLFHEKYIREDGHMIIQNYSYEFYDDKMRINMLDVLPIFETFIYQRKK